MVRNIIKCVEIIFSKNNNSQKVIHYTHFNLGEMCHALADLPGERENVLRADGIIQRYIRRVSLLPQAVWRG